MAQLVSSLPPVPAYQAAHLLLSAPGALRPAGFCRLGASLMTAFEVLHAGRVYPDGAIELHGYEKARRIGMLAMVGGKDKTRIRNATPPEFRDVLIDIARRTRIDAARHAA